jgi:hypothetical protein
MIDLPTARTVDILLREEIRRGASLPTTAGVVRHGAVEQHRRTEQLTLAARELRPPVQLPVGVSPVPRAALIRVIRHLGGPSREPSSGGSPSTRRWVVMWSPSFECLVGGDGDRLACKPTITLE